MPVAGASENAIYPTYVTSCTLSKGKLEVKMQQMYKLATDHYAQGWNHRLNDHQRPASVSTADAHAADASAMRNSKIELPP